MNLNKIRAENETKSLLLSCIKNCETLNKPTHSKEQEILKFKLTKPRETFLFNPPISIEGAWMTGLRSQVNYNCKFRSIQFYL